ncbi:MAG: ribosomal-protein-alanine N-acetyltransferase [Nitrospirales bacterium]|nr:MAG: ribosomal-protein-alanine N-acetyltransferase [Nitrospirales bacterium]
MNADQKKTPEPELGQAHGLQRATANHWAIQRATLGNLDGLVALEEACFSVPWSRKSFEAELEGNQFSRVLMIPHPEDELKVQAIGYICAWIIFEEIRFLNVAVHPEFRRQGLARQLIGEALRLGREAGCCRGMLEVRETNAAAKNLYESFQFLAYATRKSYYTNPTEDAILMTLESLSTPQTERREERGNPVNNHSSIHTVS